MIPLRDRCEVLTPATRSSAYSTTSVIDWSLPPVQIVSTRCEVRPLGSSETVGNRSQVQTRYRLLTGPGVTIDPTNRIRYGGIDYEVDGDTERHTLAGRPHHLEMIIRRVTG